MCMFYFDFDWGKNSKICNSMSVCLTLNQVSENNSSKTLIYLNLSLSVYLFSFSFLSFFFFSFLFPLLLFGGRTFVFLFGE